MKSERDEWVHASLKRDENGVLQLINHRHDSVHTFADIEQLRSLYNRAYQFMKNTGEIVVELSDIVD